MPEVSGSNALSSPNIPVATNRHLGRYTLLARLASGGMAEIFLARQQGVQGFEKLVVVKRILASFAEDPEFVTMFLEEGRLAGQLSHPHVVQTFDLGEDQGNYFIAMEYIAGESLAMVARSARIQGRSLDMRVAARLISQAAEALDYAHRKTDIVGKQLHIVHRDISPQNLLVTYDGMMKVVDFGIAKASTRASHTQQGQVRGKLSYMAPEQMTEGGIIDGRSDLFSLGVVLFEMVTGSRLVEGGDPARAVGVICGTQPLPTAMSRRPDVDPRLNAIIMKAMHRDQDQRFQTGGDLHRSLEQWLAGVGMVSAGEISEFMHELFAQRLTDRQALIERALRGELETLPQVVQAESPSDRSMPDHSNKTLLRYHALASRWRGMAVGAGALALVAVGAWALRLPRATTTPAAPKVAATELPKPAHSGPAPVILTRPIDARASEVPPATVPGSPEGTAPSLPTPVAAQPILGKPASSPVGPTPVAVAKPPEVPAHGSMVAAVPTPVPVAPHQDVPAKAKSPTHERKHASVGREGKLSLDTNPWTEVYWKGKDLGQTPLFEVALPPGAQQLVLKNPGESVEQTVEVEIKPGEVTTQKLHL